MSKFPAPKFFATDKDVHDLLTKLNMESLLEVAKWRGILLSHNSQKDSVVNYLSRQMFSLSQLQEALKLMEREEKEEKATPSKIDSKADIPAVAQAFETVRENSKSSDDQMKVTQRPSGELEVKYTYTHLDFSLATLRQRTSREIIFIVKKSGDILDFSYNNNPKAAEIYSAVKAVIKGEEPTKITECVSLSGIQDTGERIKFFLEMMNGVAGYRLRVVRDVKAERMSGSKPDPNEGDSESTEQLEDMVKKMALIGGSVWTSPEFTNMVKNGFFVYNAKWLATEIEGENRTVEFDAGFSSGECLDFSVRIPGFYKRLDSGDLEKKISPLNGMEREIIRGHVQDSAFTAINTIQPPKEPEAVTNLPPAI